MIDKTSSAKAPPPIDFDEVRTEYFEFGEHLVTVRTIGGHQDITIDRRRMAYWVSSQGFNLEAAAYSPPQPSLLGAVAAYLRVPESKARLLSNLAFDHDAAADPDNNAGFLAEPSLWCGRRNILQLNSSERALLADALNKMYAAGVIHDLAKEHYDSWFRIHRGPAFLPWHRHFIWRFEKHLQSHHAGLRAPYWDWTRNDSQDLEQGIWKSFFGGRANQGGYFDHWELERAPHPGDSLPTPAQILSRLQSPSNATFELFRQIEGHHHSGPHLWVGGDMQDQRSPRDPLFFLHHCNIDRLWAVWQRLHPDAEQYPANGGQVDDTAFSSNVPLTSQMAGGATPQSMLDHTALGIIFRRDEALEADALAAGVPSFPSGDSTRRLRAPSRVSFGLVFAGSIVVRKITIRNSGTLPITVSVEPQSHLGSYISWSGFHGEIRPCSSQDLNAVFAPIRPNDDVVAELVIHSDAEPSTARVSLRGSTHGGLVP